MLVYWNCQQNRCLFWGLGVSTRQFEKQSGYDLWHWRLAHASNQTIWDTIKCAIGLESLKKMTFERHTKCLSWMIGKATLEDYPKAKRLINNPPYQVQMDSFSSSVKPIERYNHAIVFINTTWISMDLWNENQGLCNQGVVNETMLLNMNSRKWCNCCLFPGI